MQPHETSRPAATPRRAGDEHFRTAFDHAVVGMALVGLDGRFLEVNRALCEMLGRPEGELIGTDYTEVTYPADLERCRTLMARVAAGEIESFREEKRYVHKDGHVIWAELSAALVRGPDGEPLHLVGSIRDISHHKRAEEALRSSELRFQVIAHATNDVVWDWNLKTGAVWWSHGLWELFGYPPGAAGNTIEWWRERIHPDDRAGVERDLGRLLDGDGMAWRREYRFARAGGDYAYVMDRGRVLRDAEGAPFRLLGALVDLTAQRQMQDALRASESRFAVAFHASPVPSSISALDSGEIIDANDALLDELGYDRSEVIGRVSTEVGLWERGEDREEMARLLREEGRVRNLEVVVLTKHLRRRTVLVSAGLIELDGRRCILMTANDITERKRLEEQLLQAQRMEAVGRLAGGIAHDFNNLLTVIGGYSGLMLRKLSPGDPLERDALEVLKAADSAASLTRQLLAFSRKQILQPKVLDLNTVVGRMERMLGRLIGEDVHMVVRLDPELGHVNADPGQLEQVIANLAVNARDAMPDGGTLTIETSNVEIGERDDAYSRAQPGWYARLSVRDTGTGIDETTLEHIFEPFFTTKELGRGTGLGLSTVYGIVKQSGGLIRVESEPGRGAVFEVLLPVVLGELESTAGDLERPRPLRNTETILLVEDNDDVRHLASRILGQEGYTVLEAGSGAAALGVRDRYDGPIDLVVTDVVMPLMSGPELVARLKADRPGLKTLFMSGYTDDALVIPGKLSPGDAFIGKPFSPDLLARAVRDALDAKAP